MKKENFIDKNFSDRVILSNNRSLHDETRGDILRKEDNGSWISIYQSSAEYIIKSLKNLEDIWTVFYKQN